MNNLPNLVTFLRILLIPFLVLIFYWPFHGNNFVCAGIFILAALTDWLDGFLARTLAQTSKFGAFFDPVADKLIIVAALVLLVGEKDLPFLAVPATIIIGREIIISALREWMAEVGKRASVKVNLIAKVKTTTQMIAVTILLLYKPGVAHLWLGVLGYILLSVAALLTLWSMVIYLKAAWPDLTLTTK